MHLRKLAVVFAAAMVLAHGAAAQTDAADAGTPPAKRGTSKRSTRASKASKSGATNAAVKDAAGSDAAGSATTKKKSSRSRKAKKAPPPKPAEPTVDEDTRKALEAAQTTAPAAPAPAPPPAPAAAPAAPASEPSAAAEDNDPPFVSHTPVARAIRGKPLLIAARATDPSGVFGPVLYLRKKGMGTGEYIPIKMVGSKLTQGDYTVEVPPGLLGVDTLEYYIEAWDNAGNGPARAGAPESPFNIKIEDEKKQIIVAPRPSDPVAPTTAVTINPKGAPPAISHTAMTQATKGRNIEINARLVGDTGVQGATVLFRHVGEKNFKALPMGDLGGDKWTATIPAQMTQSDLEYYLEAFDKFGNGPGRSGAPAAPYVIKVLESMPTMTINRSGSTTGGDGGPRLVRAPSRANPGRAVGWLLMAGFVGGGIFAGGEALGALQTHNAYTHTFEYEGRLQPELLDRANAYSRRAKTAGIVAGASLVASIVLLIVFPEHPDTVLVGGAGGDVGFKF